MVAFFEQNWWKVGHDPIVHRNDLHRVLENGRGHLAMQVVTNRILHIVWQVFFFGSLIVEHIVVENLNKHIQIAILLIGIETDPKNLLLSRLCF